MKLSDETKLKLYPVALGIMGFCLLALLFTRIDIILPTPAPEATAPEPVIPPSPTPTPAIEASPLPSPSPTPAPSPPAVTQSPNRATNSDRQGSLKVSNQTTYPVRVALLFQKAGQPSAQPSYNQPVHWDFAPGEGGNSGLLLSLPDGNLQVKPGDVLMAFAEDGSRRYWGPFVVGQTSLPSWNGTQREWTLLLQQ